jgi:GTPase
MFVDSVILTLSAGKGGNGVVAWRREKYIPKGGPTGGNGGRGGSIYIIADKQTLSLESYRNKRILAAQNGQVGGSNLKQGKAGTDLILKVPCGTLIKDKKTKEILFDLTEDKQKILICKGGKGGKGNNHFKSPTHQAPHFCTEGTPGESLEVELELKLIADVGLVGMPNAGKSTLISSVSSIPVKIGAYPFTTLFPNLGFIRYPDQTKLLVADIPGIIENAHLDKGLGIAFLRHVERTSLLIFVVDISGFEGRDPLEDFKILQKELSAYKTLMQDKPFLVALNKIDMEGSQENVERFRKEIDLPPEIVFPISAQAKEGLEPLLIAIKELADKQKQEEEKESSEEPSFSPPT